MKKRIIAMVLSVAMMLTMFPTGVLADDFVNDEENTPSVTETAEGQSNDNQGEESDTAQVNAVEDEETQPETEKPENDQTEPEQTENDQTEPTQNETDQAAPEQTETNQTEQPEPGSTVPDQDGTQPDDKQPEPDQPATDPAENGVSDGAENTEGEQAESKTEFTVTWESEGETILTKTFAEGTSKDEVEDAQPVEDPVKEADGDVAYEFAGWTPDYADVTADQTYTAKFEEAEQDEQDEMVSTASLVEPAADTDKGDYTVVAGEKITLTGSGGSYSYRWHSWTTSAPEIATVSMNDNGYQVTVTGVKTGTATITHTWWNRRETFTVEVKETEPAIVYYLKLPTSDPDSNETSEWGKTPYGTAEVNVASAPCDDGKNVFTPSQYVRSYSDGEMVTVDGVKRCRVTKGTSVWNEIFDAYKQQIEDQFNNVENGNQSTGDRLTITTDDVEYIDLVPYKISKNNSTTPDKHLDCTVKIKCKKIVTAKFWVIMPNGQPQQAYANNFRIDDQLNAPALSENAYPGTKVYNGKTYVLNRDTWYTDTACTNAATLPTTITADGEYQYYVKYKLQQTDISGLTVQAPDDVTYNSKPQEQKPVVTDGEKVLVEGTDYTLSYSEDTTNVGTVTVTVTGKGNYSGETTVTYQIKPKAVTVTAINNSKVYGDADPELKATVAGNLNGDAIAYTLSRAEGENVGHYAITATGSKVQGNYEVSFVNGDFEITRNAAMTVTGAPYTGVYDGEAHGEAATASVTEGTKVEYKVGEGDWTEEVPTITDVGTQTVKVRATNPNYNEATAEYTLNVTPKAVTVTAINNSKVYGDADPELKATVAGNLNGDAIAYTLSRAEGENVGHYAITAAGAEEQGNYKVSFVNGDFEITAKNIVPGENNKDLTATTPEDVVYSGESQQQKPIVKDGDKVLEEGKDYTLTYSEDTTNAGTVTVTINGNGNYGSKFEVTYKITPAPLKITTNSAEKTYDGSALTADGKIEGLVKGETATLKTTGSQTEVGESKNTYEIEWGDATKASNYEITEDIGTLTVNKRSSGGGSSSKPAPEEEPTPTPTPTPLPTLPTTPAPTTPARRVTRSTATVTEPASRPTEQITENETPKAESEPEVIEDEETPLAPMATGAWALVNLILMLLTVLASLLLLLGYLGKKKYAKEDEYGNALHDANGNEIIDYTRNKKGFWRVASLIPAIAAVIAFALTENMRLPMVMTDRWTLLMVIIAVVQLIVAVLCKKKKESEEDENQANA